MSTRRNALGRGLGALIPSAATDAAATAPDPKPRSIGPEMGREAPREQASGPAQIAVDAIDPNPEQPRRVFDRDQLASLADSIREHGVLQPIVVRRAGERYQLVVGERRWRATDAAGLSTIPAVIADVEDQQRLELAIVENVQRHDLNPIELAYAYRALAQAGATQEEIGRRVSKDRSSVANHLRLLELSREMQEDVETGLLTMGHAKALLQVNSPERRRHLRNRVAKDGLSVRETERLGRGIAGPAPARGRKTVPDVDQSDPHTTALIEALERQLQTRVRLKRTGERGSIEIEFYDRDGLDRIARILLEGE
jgi:ParB family chromosome partitioning protein